MKYAAMVLGFLAMTLLALPGLTAQEKDKKGDKAEKKEGDEPAKKDKEKKPVEEVPEHGQKVQTKILSMRPDSAREFTIEMKLPDPQRVFNFQMWQAQQMASISQSPNPQVYAQRMAAYQNALPGQQAGIYTAKPFDVRAAEGCKVRTMFAPVQYDDAGNLKKWTKKELEAMKKNSKMPGFPADFDALKTGQWVELYLAKQPTGKGGAKSPPAKDKKKKDDDDPLPETRPDVVMIVIWAEPMGR
jgi:hypothetical protein